MKTALIQACMAPVVAAAAMASAPAMAMDVLARVMSSTPVVQQLAVPRQVCANETVLTQVPKSGAGALMGAIAGGAAGNAIGSGGGRAVATLIGLVGLVGGAMVGEQIEGPSSQLQNVQQCSTQTFYENRTSHFNVVYEYQGAQYTAQMPNDPGLHLRLRVTPVGTVEPVAQPFQPAPQTYYYPPAAVQQQPVYEQPALTAPVFYPAYAPRPYYYAPSYAPIGLSLNFGYSRGFGGGHHGRWR